MKRLCLTAALLAALFTQARAEGAQVDGTVRLLASHTVQSVADTGTNPENFLFELPSATTLAQARVNLSLEWEFLRLWAEPRGYLTRTEYTIGGEDSRDTTAEAELLQGGGMISVGDSLFLSLARENLQWGPAQSMNPSNPFFPQNGRENPMREIAGMDFARLVWLPAPGFTLSLIANTARGEGPQLYGGWRPSQALKLDYTGGTSSVGLIAHGGEEVDESIGGYAQWTGSDALLVYGELRALSGSRQPHPVADASPVGGHLEARYAGGSHRFYKALGGLSYTLLFGPTLSVEYFYNQEGYDDGEAELFADMGERAGAFLAAGLAKPRRVAELGSTPLRRNYAMVQYLQTEILSRGTLLARYTRNLDDASGVATFYGDWAMNDLITFYANGSYFFGGGRSEYGMALDYQATFGVEVALF